MIYGMQDIGRNMFGQSSRSEQLRHNEFWAVDDVSFELRKGETLGIIGPNGSGKTTLLKMLNGIFWPDKGKITIKGRVGALIAVGAGFHPLLTGRENIYINAAILGMSKQEVDAKFDEIVDFADIGDFLDSPVKHYSSGMFVRLGFAVAVHCKPEILLVDEVLAVGDTSFRRKSSERMKALLESGETSIILISHDMHAIKAISDRAILLYNGQMKAFGSVGDVIAQYDLLMRPQKKIESTTKTPDSKKGQLSLIKKYDGYAGDEVIIENVWLESDQGEKRIQFKTNEDVSVYISYTICVPHMCITKGFVWLAFINEWNINCMGTRLSLEELITPKVLPNKGILCARFSPLQLTTSSYFISLAFFDHTFTVPYAQGHYGYVKVSNDFPTFVPGENTPVCWPKCEWSFIA